MKKFFFLALSLLLCISLLAGCRDNEPMETTRPTMAPETTPSTAPTTMPATTPSETTLPTTGTTPSETMDHGNGPLDSTDSTAGTNSGAESRTGTPMPSNR